MRDGYRFARQSGKLLIGIKTLYLSLIKATGSFFENLIESIQFERFGNKTVHA
tara:strand:- start:54 stop:212 length:159 start_codon:yes stop_codon:yes gene_type:complete